VERLLSDCTDVAKWFFKMCIVFLLTLFFFHVSRQDSDKCFICNSQEPYDAYNHRNSHRVENVIYQRDRRGELTWWQSVNVTCDYLHILTISILLNFSIQ